MNNHDTNSPDDFGDPRITGYILGELEPDQSAAFEKDIAADPHLAAQVDQQRGFVDNLQSLLGDEVDATPPPEVPESSVSEPALATATGAEASVVANQSDANRSDAMGTANRQGSYLPLFATAAVVLLIVGGMMLPIFRQSNAPTVAMSDKDGADPARQSTRGIGPVVETMATAVNEESLADRSETMDSRTDGPQPFSSNVAPGERTRQRKVQSCRNRPSSNLSGNQRRPKR